MALWSLTLDPYISVYPPSNTSFLPIVYSPPGSPISVHIGVYLPTSGQESQFVDNLLELQVVIEELNDKYDKPIIFIRGDSNVNANNKRRSKIFAHFCSSFDLVRVPIGHNTYHHFVGDGLFDSDIDVILHSASSEYSETVVKVYCKNDFPEVDSSHDLILSTLYIASPYK